MEVKVINWAVLVKALANKSGLNKKEIYLTAGLAGAAAAAEPRHSEGEVILKLFNKHKCGKVPMLLKSSETRCPNCSRHIGRPELIRYKANNYRCARCLEGAKK